MPSAAMLILLSLFAQKKGAEKRTSVAIAIGIDADFFSLEHVIGQNRALRA